MGVDINCSNGEGILNAINWSKERVYNILLSRPELDLRLARWWRDGGTGDRGVTLIVNCVTV